MSDLRTAAQQALEAWDAGDTEWFKRAYSVMDALRAALVEDAMQKFTDVNQELEAALADGDRVAPTEPAQEPVAVVRSVVGQGDDGVRIKWLSGFAQIGDRLYTAPPQRKPLTEEEIEVAAKSVPAAVYELMHGHEITVGKFRAALAEFARAIERAHGIGDQP